jgi:hypothetical protein
LLGPWKGANNVILVVLESPYAADSQAGIDLNVRYARAAMADCLHKGEAPYASHLLYTQPGVLRDSDPTERRKGMEAGFAWGRWASYRVFYLDRGLTGGMVEGLKEAHNHAQVVHVRSLTGWFGTETRIGIKALEQHLELLGFAPWAVRWEVIR